MSKKLNILFSGRQLERYDFLDNFCDKTCDFLDRGPSRDLELHKIIREITKNIYDHNGSYGYANMEITPNDLFIIELGNYPCPNSIEKEHNPDRKVNCNVGLSILHELDIPSIKIEINRDVDYKYKVTYDRSLWPANRLKLL